MKWRRQAFDYRRQHLTRLLEERGGLFWALVGVGFVLLVGWLDLITGYELAFSLFYFAPISLTAWYAGRRVGLPIALLSAFSWLFAEVTAGQAFSSQSVVIWNTVVRSSVFMLIALLTADLRRSMYEERRLSRTDGTTGALNSRYFLHLLELEIDRATRFQHPFTLVFIDMDNFKQVNDTFGHLNGDEVLRNFAHAAQQNLRKSDLLGRMGGDEFAILLSVLDENTAKETLERIRLTTMAEMESLGVPVTISMGAVTFNQNPGEPDRAIRMADHLMYDAKRSGKNRLLTAIFPNTED
ncbi:MAG: diguanylate cyclase [Anaerolineae bacterium]|nr:MAG: diguanylate cyclase [Anaerolineae bacterium]